MNILFICKHNRFRSKVGEALFKKYNNNKNIQAFSAGTHLDKKRLYVAPNVKRALKKFGVKRVDTKSRNLTRAMINKADIIVNVADDVKLPKNLVSGKKVLNWKINDTSQKDYTGIIQRVRLIRSKIKNLLKTFKNLN